MYTDHDLLVRLAAQFDVHSRRENEVSRETLARLTELSAKFDQMRENRAEHTMRLYKEQPR